MKKITLSNKVLKIYDYAKMVNLAAGYDDYIIYIENLIQQNYYKSLTPQKFFKQYTWVVFTCGFNASVVREHWNNIKKVLFEFDIGKVKALSDEELLLRIPIKNKKKVASIIRASQIITENWLSKIKTASCPEEIKSILLELPHIGGVTIYHLMRNIGIDCFKPDRHIVNIAKSLNSEPEEIFNIIIQSGKERFVGLADHVLWRASSILGVEKLIEDALKDRPIQTAFHTTKEKSLDFML
jgi:hypothetical protein